MEIIDIHCVNIWDFHGINILFKQDEKKSEGRVTCGHTQG